MTWDGVPYYVFAPIGSLRHPCIKCDGTVEYWGIYCSGECARRDEADGWPARDRWDAKNAN